MTATVPVSKSLKQKLKQICNELKTYRHRKGISASLLAKKASITRVTLSKLEQGDIGVSVGIWLKVLSVLESTDKFLNLLSSAINKNSASSKNVKKTTTKTKIKSKAIAKTSTKPKTKAKTKSKVRSTKSKPIAKTKALKTSRSKSSKRSRK